MSTKTTETTFTGPKISKEFIVSMKKYNMKAVCKSRILKIFAYFVVCVDISN